MSWSIELAEAEIIELLFQLGLLSKRLNSTELGRHNAFIIDGVIEKLRETHEQTTEEG